MRTRSLFTKALGICGLMAATVMFGCQEGNTRTVSWHENGTPEFHNSKDTWWSYQFVYHPYQEVYFEPYSRTFTWKNDAGEWTSSATLPDEIWLDHSTAQVVKLQQTDPVVQHLYAKSITFPGRTPARTHASAPFTYGY